MLNIAFKEWAVICQALASGKQALILRKGGIAEDSGVFRVEHNRFWLYPTWLHQQAEGIQDEAKPLLDLVQSQKPPEGVLRLTHWAEVTGVYHVKDRLSARLLGHLHSWSDETVQKRFDYRQPGLYVLVVRVFASPEAFELPELALYAGCKSWVELECELPTAGGKAVLSEEDLADLHRQLDLLLNPSALA